MIRNRRRTDEGLTGLELVILVLVLVVITIFLLAPADEEDTSVLARTFPSGLLAESMYMSGDHIQTVGNVYGFPMVSRASGKLPIVIIHEDPGRLGAVQGVVSLFMGNTGAIDMDRVQVQWNREGSSESIQRTTTRTLVCPNWTISGKYNMLPGRTADSDDWLEPNEQFELTICPSEGIQPYGRLSLTLQPDGVAVPLVIARTVPPRIQPVMNLG
ncbi:MAG: hypothetical protein LUQ71_00995 [Methanoregula sp.]|nr:hypothetical protein [Methanoregula sp.]